MNFKPDPKNKKVYLISGIIGLLIGIILKVIATNSGATGILKAILDIISYAAISFGVWNFYDLIRVRGKNIRCRWSGGAECGNHTRPLYT